MISRIDAQGCHIINAGNQADSISFTFPRPPSVCFTIHWQGLQVTVTQTNYKLRQLKDNSVAECIRMGRTGYCTTFFCDLQFPACQSALMHSIHDVTVIPRGMHGDSQHFEYEQPFPLKMFQPPTFTHTNSRWTRWRASWQSFRTENPFGSNILLATGSNHLLAIIGLATGS